MSEKIAEALNYLLYAHNVGGLVESQNEGVVVNDTVSGKYSSASFDANASTNDYVNRIKTCDILIHELAMLDLIEPRSGKEEELKALIEQLESDSPPDDIYKKIVKASSNLSFPNALRHVFSAKGMTFSLNGQNEQEAIASIVDRAEDVIELTRQEFKENIGELGGQKVRFTNLEEDRRSGRDQNKR